MLKVIIINTVVYTADSNRAEGPLHAGTFSKKGFCITRGSLYFNFHQKWSKLSTLLQKDTNKIEMKKLKFFTVCLVKGHSFDSVFC